MITQNKKFAFKSIPDDGFVFRFYKNLLDNWLDFNCARTRDTVVNRYHPIPEQLESEFFNILTKYLAASIHHFLVAGEKHHTNAITTRCRQLKAQATAFF